MRAAVCALVLGGFLAGQAQASEKTRAVKAIRQVFGHYAEQAVRVATCETGGTFLLTSENGQYRGLFQMGSWERATFAHGQYMTALDQVRAAWRYFCYSGRAWGPWECKP